MSGSLETWVSDNLLSFLGQSDSTTVHYFITLGTHLSSYPLTPAILTRVCVIASSSKSPSALISTLTSQGLPSTSQATQFATQLYSKAPRKAGTSSLKAQKNAEEARKKTEKEKKQLQGARFSLMLDDDNEPPEEKKLKKSSSKSKEKDSKGKGKASGATGAGGGAREMRRRDANGDNWESDEEERAIKRAKIEERYAREDAQARQKRRDKGEGSSEDERDQEEEEEDPDVRRERERAADLEERDAFARRMKDKDKDRTKKLVEDRSSKNADPARAALLEAEDPTKQMGDLRERSRQQYLGKREQQQLDLLRLELADWERDFRGVKMTKSERKEFESKKELLRLAEERLAIDDGGDGYMMPDGESQLYFKQLL